ncbi:glycoside hydrolase family 3 C-terminal domain-containing protein [Qipengyuania aurantiaca]|uniref:Glycoside hydrolase family 3 C-terminal domain-containing protein n=1 Tax=Qipengyuania aurantiaca TaxID=2867233 RepID=A0ABX8ZQJ9_9SPHN|nr:glycoside hydrolase family 3 C-terminal domain-containing protein [Qipengyuania aurantiaca]QZD90379.1 glycoside hydrolase family 3 C-terminal domain-containing protein [Qipengyuania aurantiaca]
MTAAFNHIECERVVADLLGMLSPAEKAGQLVMRPVPPVEDREATESFLADLRAGRIGTVTGVGDAQEAENLQRLAQTETRLGIPLLIPAETGSGVETIFPSALAVAASWDADAVEAAGAVLAQELDARGANWALTPPLPPSGIGGLEGPQADTAHTHLGAQLAAAHIRGLQGRSSLRSPGVLANLAFGASARGQAISAESKAVAALELAHTAIGEGAVGSLACDAITREMQPAFETAFGLLKGPGGFDGVFLCEWKALAAELAGDELAQADEREIDPDTLVEALQTGRIDRHRVDDMAARVLRAKYRLGLLSSAIVGSVRPQRHTMPTPIHNRESALDLARRSPVLLRNEPALLPLGIDSGDVLVVGPTAADRHAPLDGRAGVAASLLDGLEQLGVPHRYVPGLALRDADQPVDALIGADSMAIGMACEAAKRAGTIVLAIGGNAQGELGDAENALLGGLASVTERLILVGMGAAPLDPRLSGRTQGTVLHAGRLGTMSGHAIAELLTGEASPCGKLPLTLARPDGAPGLPFGHGLTYGDFALTDLRIEVGRQRIYASALLRNAGEVAGLETVQLYVGGRGAADEDPEPLRLADFQRVRLHAGGSEHLTFELGRKEIGHFAANGSFRIEEGDLTIAMGLSSARLMTETVAISDELARSLAGADRRLGNLPIRPVVRRRA